MFNNLVIRQVKPDKPHIQFMYGYWRVSPCLPNAYALIGKAHQFVGLMNAMPEWRPGQPHFQRIQGRGWSYEKI